MKHPCASQRGNGTQFKTLGDVDGAICVGSNDAAKNAEMLLAPIETRIRHRGRIIKPESDLSSKIPLISGAFCIMMIRKRNGRGNQSMVITISREYGAGGHSIGQSVAKELGITFYDRDIIKATVAKSGMDSEDIERIEEEITHTDLLLQMISPISLFDQRSLVSDLERGIILKLATEGSCVILGRCADYILRREGITSLDVFLFADEIHRAARVSELIGSKDPTEIQRKMQKRDAARRTYYQHYTGNRWGDSRNYSLSLDTGLLGYDTCVRLICAAARECDAAGE